MMLTGSEQQAWVVGLSGFLALRVHIIGCCVCHIWQYERCAIRVFTCGGFLDYLIATDSCAQICEADIGILLAAKTWKSNN